MIRFTSPDESLNAGFAWAVSQATAYAHEGDPVGAWYDASLPNRYAFCIRDVCHQANGAHALGLERHTKNMLTKFVQSIAQSRDFCCFWEIDKNYRPAPVDYTSDEDFWYNLPANFDLLYACLRMYRLTGDRDYLESEDFLHFYRLTVENYIRTWDKDGDGIPEGGRGRRGIPSYEEGEGSGAVQMLDLLAAEAAALAAYAAICGLRGENGDKYRAQSEAILAEIDRRWDEDDRRFYFAKGKDGQLIHLSAIATECVVYFDAVTDKRKADITLDRLDERGKTPGKMNVEVMSHLPEIFYSYGRYAEGEYWLRHITAPELHRREYPEVSFAAVGAFVFGMMGVRYHVDTRTITAEPHLPEGMSEATLTGLPVFGKTADILVKDGSVEIVYR